MNEFFTTLLSLTVGGSILAALLLGVKALLGKKLPSMFYYYAWLVVLLRFLLPIPGVAHYERVVPESAQPTLAAWDSETLRPAAYKNPTGYHMDYTGMMPQAAPEETPLEVPPEASSGLTSVADQQPIHEPTVPTQSRKAPVLSLTLTPAQWILFIWAGGAAASILFFLLSYGRFIRALNKTLRRPNLRDLEIYRDLDGPRRLRLLRSCGVNTPMQLGLFRPKLVLPEREYTNGMLESILRHELTHYNRHDILYKWFALTVCCLHWFNPLLWIIRRELDRDCELSCDERLLKSMSVQEKRSYGETLLALANDRALSRRVIATSFATEKRNLKERLEQIMTYRHMGKATVALTLCLCVLLGCFAVAAGPAQAAQTPEADVPTETVNAPELTEQPAKTEEPMGEEILGVDTCVTVSTVDEFLAAIAPGWSIGLKAGDYNLCEASTYPKEDPRKMMEEGRVGEGSDYYYWAPDYDGYSLVIHGVRLALQAEKGATVQIVTEPRYADVLRFEFCEIYLGDLTVGHTVATGRCTGGVLSFYHMDSVWVEGCSLYGCGTWGVIATDCRQMQVTDSKIYHCSEGAVKFNMCRNVQLDSCEIYECEGGFGGGLLEMSHCEQMAFTNSHIYDNKNVQLLVAADERTDGVVMGGLLVENNEFGYALYASTLNPIIFSKCDIRESNMLPEGYKGSNESFLTAVNPEGKELSDDDADFHNLDRVTWPQITWPQRRKQASAVMEPDADSMIYVSTVDEFLAAIAPGANIVLKDGDYNLTRASNYPRKSENERWEEITEGKVTQGSDYYHWAPCYDGYSLSISGVNNLTIQAEEGASVQIITSPRYADVLHFEGCQDINLRNLTVGHTIEKGSCTGGVLDFEGTANVVVDGCSLYGCGTWGVYARYCRQMQVIGSRIYDCSEGAVQLGGCQDIQVDSCEIYECTASFGGLLKVWQSEQIAFTNSHIYNNTDVQFLIEAYDGSQGVYMGGLLVENNEFKNALYTCTQAPITFSHCEIRESNTLPGSYMGRNEGNLNFLAAVSPEGEQLSDNDADFHSRGTVIWAADMKKPAPEAVEPDTDGMIHVSSVDEFLAAIGPDRTVYLEPGDYDLTTASSYGKLGGYYYTWTEEFDGYSLTLQNIKGLTIAGAGVDQVNIVTVPRYADVLLLQNCEDVTLRDFTAGHTVEPGYCAGDVLQMENCRRIEVSGCSLFGCGVYGVNGYYCDNLKVENTEIHHCSQGVALLFGCTNVSFIGCDIHDNFYEYEVDGKIERFDSNEICTNQGNYPVESGKNYLF